ncbi:uncharacterized protein LOC110666483 isoform X2 [Hevea brasiliensis]|uniref:uncharacterized protein LOC110666483 isoform X2 n=1 Tax=Hevea brasiliensis TaxID=3981 RepID=UPI0025FEE9BB|nr:uncharacterized protein LOC110666483 isoform X2 [Hevea brasiliensis]
MIETDKSRDVRRGASRFSRQIKQSGHKFISPGSNGKATSSNGDDYEMDCELTDREQAFPSQAPSSVRSSGTIKRFNLPRKQFFDDCNGGDHISVPRKLRSAMKKRNRESLSTPFPNSKKLNHSTSGVKSPKRVGIKKPKQNLKQGAPNYSLKQNVGGPITKDEEEVVETLYALAGMFPNLDPDRNKLDSASLEASSFALPEASERHQPKLDDSVTIKEDLNLICRSRTDEDVNPASDIERSAEETTKVYSLNGPSTQELNGPSTQELNGPSTQEPSDLIIGERLHGELDSSVAQVNLHEAMVKLEEQKLPCNLANFCFPPGPHQDTGKLRQPAKLETSFLDRKTEISLAETTTIGNQPDQQHALDKSKNNVLWPGLSSTVSSSACRGPLSQSCAAKIPAWLGTRPGSFQNGSTGKVSKVSTDRRLWKRCAAHVYIGCLIQALQMPESKESLPMPPSQLRPHEILKQGVLMTINDLSGVRNDSNGVTSASSIVNAVGKNSNDSKSDILQHLRPHQNHSQTTLASGVYTCQKQAFNFLSLSGGGGMEPINSFNGTGNGLEPFAQVQIPYYAQNPSSLMPFSLSQTRFTPAYPDQPSVAAAQQAKLQLSPHLTSPYCAPHASSKALTKQPQQQLWAAQLAAQYRNTGTSTALTRFPSWQKNGREDSPGLMPCIPPSTSTLEVLGPKYPQTSQQQQQQQFMAITMSHARMKRQDHLIPSVCEENRVGF